MNLLQVSWKIILLLAPKKHRAWPVQRLVRLLLSLTQRIVILSNEDGTSTEAQKVSSTNLVDPITGKESEISSEMPQEKTPNNDPVVIMIAGKVGKGKSTALNNGCIWKLSPPQLQ